MSLVTGVVVSAGIARTFDLDGLSGYAIQVLLVIAITVGVTLAWRWFTRRAA